jgi:hypothetical protein
LKKKKTPAKKKKRETTIRLFFFFLFPFEQGYLKNLHLLTTPLCMWALE